MSDEKEKSMTKYGQAEYSEYIAKIFVESKLSEYLNEIEQGRYIKANQRDIYDKFPSSQNVD